MFQPQLGVTEAGHGAVAERAHCPEVHGEKVEGGEADRGQRTKDKGQRTKDKGQRTEDRGQRTEDSSLNWTVPGIGWLLRLRLPGYPSAAPFPPTEAWICPAWPSYS